MRHGSVVRLSPPLCVRGPPLSVGFPLKLCLHFLLLNSFFAPHSTERGLVRTGQLSFASARRQKKDPVLFIVFADAAVMCNCLQISLGSTYNYPDANTIFQHY